MGKITPFIFLFLLLLQGVLSNPPPSPEDEDPDILDEACEPDDADETIPDDNAPSPDKPSAEGEPPKEAPAATPFTITTEQILEIAPSSKSCDEASPEFAEECRTAPVAARHISDSFEKYDINSKAEQAAILSWMAMESGEFRYSRNHFPEPGTPGQGTYNIQSFAFNFQYINAIPELHANLSSVDISSLNCGPKECSFQPTAARKSLDLILENDQYAFATGAWFMKEICTDDVKKTLANDADKGFEEFVKNCVYTTMSKERREYWETAKSALGLGSEATESESSGPGPSESGPSEPVPSKPDSPEPGPSGPDSSRPDSAEPGPKEPVPEEADPAVPDIIAKTAPEPTSVPTVLRRGDIGNSSDKRELLTIDREIIDKFKDSMKQAPNETLGLAKRNIATPEKPLRQRDFSSFLDVMFGNRMDTICTEQKSDPSVEEPRAKMSASTLSLIQTIEACSEGKAKDKSACENLPSSFSEQPSSIDLDKPLSYHHAYLSTLWLNLYSLRPTKMLAPSTKKIFNHTDTDSGPFREDSITPKPPVLRPSDLIQCTYLSSLQELSPSTLLRNVTKRTTPSSMGLTHHRRPHHHYNTNFTRNTMLHRIRADEDEAIADRAAKVIRWVDDTCAAGSHENLYSEDDMARWCDEVGKAVRAEDGALKALEAFEEWVDVI